MKNNIYISNKEKKNILALTIVLTLLYSLAFYFVFSSPVDQLHGEFVRIMYVHVPAAWLAVLLYSVIGLLNIIYLSFSVPVLGIVAYALAPIGMTFTMICLITGSLWGKPIWGTFWVWDARLTSMFVLFFLYLGYYLIWDYKEFNIKLASIVNLIGLVNIPIIKFSVYLWATLHQKSSVIRPEGISIHPSMLTPLLLMFFSSFVLTLLLWYFNSCAVLNLRKIEKLLIHEKFTK
ncbi:heme exporter CcmC family protein [Neorickettsia helminthoeca str. Oregon]|uniref:Heme exporter protein C n=1 Tax=Neorickettsia helminthoeca str. Oregon TaxID=1286528 RepID=X5HLW8_9RICK|nr:heme ABC transporter permease CcmC [Neorickettsia helminthoeca]AHX11425.1 heme exporter CcmC family protein [Neorickettsia helminthoeca str. Oregon]